MEDVNSYELVLRPAFWAALFGVVFVLPIWLNFLGPKSIVPFVLLYCFSRFLLTNSETSVMLVIIMCKTMFLLFWFHLEELSSLFHSESKYIEWKELLDSGDLEFGDLIQFDRRSTNILDRDDSSFWGIMFSSKYAHWGVYLSNDTVMHLTADSTGKIQIHARSTLKDVAMDQKCRKNNLERLAKKSGYVKGTREIIFKRAKAVLNFKDDLFVEGGNYKAMLRNCEHYATYLVYGKPMSTQSDFFVTYFIDQFTKNVLFGFIVTKLGCFLIGFWLEEGITELVRNIR